MHAFYRMAKRKKKEAHDVANLINPVAIQYNFPFSTFFLLLVGEHFSKYTNIHINAV